jgi:DNA repair exonuclease SbcCD nuclease subunit
MLARFVQLSDLHLGASFGALPPCRRADRRRIQRHVLERAVEIAIEREAHGLLIPGDLFDAEGADLETIAAAVHAFRRDGCPPVFVVPGNHDPFHARSRYWNPRLLAASGFAWPDHVHVFGTAGWSGMALDTVPVTVWGRCFMSGVETFERPLAPAALTRLAMDPDRAHVAVFHASRERACPFGQKITAPFSDDEVRRSPFTYLAAGHYHVRSEIQAGDGEPGRGVRLAYAGSATALKADELGEHGALEVRLWLEDPAPWVETEFLALDPLRVRSLELDVTGLPTTDAIERLASERIEAEGLGDHDALTLRLVGRLGRGIRAHAVGDALASRLYALRIERGALKPDYDLDAMREGEPETVEQRFARTLLDQLDATRDPEQRALVSHALYYGLDALTAGAVQPAYEDLDA